ncbi:trichohyalin-like [Ambystoma mexicanum]|uniref:trichohyalin-like n=1 Tax=Ambystoma mexicanum TaxID=8296 RepID=UPI0037E83D38
MEAQKYERPSLQQGRKNSKNEKPDEVGVVSDTDNTDNNKRRLRSVKSPGTRLKLKTLLNEETTHEGKKELYTPRSRLNSPNNELREVGTTSTLCVHEPKEKDAQVTTEPVTTEPQGPEINLSGESKQDLPGSEVASALHTAPKASGFPETAVGGQPLTDPQQERCDAEDRRERREKKSSEKTTNRGAGHPALPASPDSGRARRRSPTRMENTARSGLEKRREKVRGQIDSPNENTKGTQLAELAKSQANKLTATQERERVEVDSLPQEYEEGRRLDWPKEKVPKTVVQANVHREPEFADTEEELGISENEIEEEIKQREENRTQVASSKFISNEGKASSTEESWNESETGTSDSDSEIEQEKKALEQKRKLESENDLSDAELLEAVEINSGGDSQQTPGVSPGPEGSPAIGLQQLLQEKRNAAKAIRRQIEEREERRKQSALKEHQEEQPEGGGNTSRPEDDNQRQALARERVSQPKDQQQNVDGPDGAKAHPNSDQLLRTPEKVRELHGETQQRETQKEKPKCIRLEEKAHRPRLSDSLFTEIMAMPGKIASTPKSQKNRRISELGTPTQKESPSKKPDLLTIMSAITIALAPYCKLYETIKEGIQDNTSILASMSTKITHIEGYITAVEERTDTYKKGWEKELEDLKKQIECLKRGTEEENKKTKKSERESQNAALTERHKGDNEIKEVMEKRSKPPQTYPIKSGLHNHPQNKVPVILKLKKTDRTDKDPTTEKAEQQEAEKLKGKKKEEEIREESFEKSQKERKRDKTRSPPLSVEDFMSDTNLMNLSQHWETASDNSVMEVNTDHQIQKRKEPEKEIEMRQNMKPQTPKRSREASEIQKGRATEIQKKNREEERKPSKDQRISEWSSKHGKQEIKSPEKNRRTGMSKAERQERIFKLEQLDIKSGYMILNRKTILKLMSKMNALKMIKTENITLVEPYHRGKIAKAYIHVKEPIRQETEANAATEMLQNGFGLTEIKREIQKEKKDTKYDEKERRPYQFTTRTEERYRSNRLGKQREERGIDWQVKYGRTEERKENRRSHKDEKQNTQSRKEHQDTGAEYQNLHRRVEPRRVQSFFSPERTGRHSRNERAKKSPPRQTKDTSTNTGPLAWLKAALMGKTEN